MTQRLFGFNVLTCQIIISNDSPLLGGELKDVQYILNEVHQVKINASYSNLVSTAEITLPRATLIEAATSKRPGVKTKDLMGNGQTSMFVKGQRVMISLGYDDNGNNRNNKRLFEGFIVSIDANNPYTIYCEDMGYLLRHNSVLPFSTGNKATPINALADDILKGTDLELHPLSRRMDIHANPMTIDKNLSAAEILEMLKPSGLVSFIKYYQGKPYLAITRNMFNAQDGETLLAGDSDSMPIINFQENVANDNLKFIEFGANELALTAISLRPDKTKVQFTIIRSKENPDEFQVINETKMSKKAVKNNAANTYKDAQENYKNTQNNKEGKFDLSSYNVRTFNQYNVTREELLKNAKAAFTTISQTGIEGTVTVFGDFGLQPATLVRFYDERNPDKNGVFVVSEVDTDFGVNGYRQTIKVPFKRSN